MKSLIMRATEKYFPVVLFSTLYEGNVKWSNPITMYLNLSIVFRNMIIFAY